MGTCWRLCGSQLLTTSKTFTTAMVNSTRNAHMGLWTKMKGIRSGYSHVRNTLYLLPCKQILLLNSTRSLCNSILFIASKVCEKLTDILWSRSLLKDIKMISPRYQTSSLEALHSLDIIFAPKHTAFAFLAMYAR